MSRAINIAELQVDWFVLEASYLRVVSRKSDNDTQDCVQRRRTSMQQKRYQVFISSTYEDLRNERRSVQDVIVSGGDFPVQMEDFPAADEGQFEFIKKLIDECDYYILIIAGRYGSFDDDGLSYTHKEFRYAVERKVPVLVMLRANLGDIPRDKSETSEAGSKKLKEFIEEATKERLRKQWSSADELKLRVREALDNAKRTIPRTGWVRGDTIATVDVLRELNEVRKENSAFQEKFGRHEFEIPLPALPNHDDVIEIDLFPNSSRYDRAARATYARVSCSWMTAFPILFNGLSVNYSDYGGEDHCWIDDKNSCVNIGSAFASKASSLFIDKDYEIRIIDLKRLTSYYIESGFMNPDGSDPLFTEPAQIYARRILVSKDNEGKIEVTSGKIEINYRSEKSAFNNELDDEIPF